MGDESQEKGAKPIKKGRARQKPKGFYSQVLTEAERVRLPSARSVEGLDEEIALLRVKLMTELEQHPENLDMLLKGITLLIRAVAIKYKLSPQTEENLYQKVMGVLKELGGVLMPGEFRETG